MEPYFLLVRDTNKSCVIGDVIRLRSNWRVSKHVRHVLTDIIKPFEKPLSERPPVPTIKELQTEYETYRFAKDLRQAARGREASTERILEYPASEIYESLLEINAGIRQQLINEWRRTIALVPNSTSTAPSNTAESTPKKTTTLQRDVRDLLKEMKPRVKQVLDQSSEATPAERRKDINERLHQQGENLVNIKSLRQVIEQVRSMLDPSEQHNTEGGNGRIDLDQIRATFRRSFSPQSSPHIVLESASIEKPIDS
jgi:hypothetical protein